MGICCSKKGPSPPPSNPISNDPPKVKKVEEKRREAAASQQVAAEPAEKKTVFAITQNKKTAVVPAATEKDKKEEQLPRKKAQQDGHGSGSRGAAPTTSEDLRPAPVRTSSCTKEEVDAILIQCGRLSRSSSGKTSAETGGGGHHRRYSGSKRSYDFDNEKGRDDGGEELEKISSRPSPHRRTPNRERDGGGEYKRSGSRERASGGGRRVSRSPGRRSDGPASSSSAGDKTKQPGKLVSVPAREKGKAVAEAGGVGAKRSSSTAVANKRGGEVGGRRSASPRSRSPANTTKVSNENVLHHNTQIQPQPLSLSRSSSRKAEQSPYRRSPMAEIDDNTLKVEQQHPSRNQNNNNTNKLQKRSQSQTQTQTQKASESSGQMSKLDQRNFTAAEISNGSKGNSTISSCVREQLISYRAKEQQPELEIMEEAAEVKKGASKGIEVPLTSTAVDSLNPRTITSTRSSRRSSRDLDQILSLKPDTLLNPTTYNSLLLEDINHYHQNTTTTAFSLPACVSKACSILEAVADLNSSYSDNKSEGSNNDNNGRFGRSLAQREPFVESEIVVKDDLMEPSLHKYVTVRGMRGEMEPQESAGSNSFIGQPWASPWEPNSVDSNDHCWTSRSDKSEEVEEQQPSPEAAHARGRRSRMHGSGSNSLPAATMSSSKKRELDHRRGGGNEKASGRAVSHPVTTAATSS